LVIQLPVGILRLLKSPWMMMPVIFRMVPH